MNDFSVLVVDDDQVVREIAKFAFDEYAADRKCSVRVVEAATTAEGLEALAKSSFDLIVSDVNFDLKDKYNKDGIEFVKAARAMGYKGKIVACSSSSGFEREALSAGANKFVSKAYLTNLMNSSDEAVIAEYASWLT